jgi:hypothetical protein
MPVKKPVRYNIKDLISEYNEDVSSRINIKLVPQKGGGWSAQIDDSGDAIIGYSKSEYPDAAFAHELLHIKAELDGLKDPYVRSNEPGIDWTLIRFFINQLTHHRFYEEFYDMGFSENEFLNDNDYDDTRRTLNRDVGTLEKLRKGAGEPLRGLVVLMPYLVCISPNETSKEIQDFKERIINVSDPIFISEINDIITEWVSSKRMDYCLTLAKLFKACGKLKISFAPQSDTTKEISAASV